MMSLQVPGIYISFILEVSIIIFVSVYYLLNAY